jgi:hypothetical protein
VFGGAGGGGGGGATCRRCRYHHHIFFTQQGPKRLQKKSDNLQYNTLVRWFAGTNDSAIKHLMFQVLYKNKTKEF